MSLPDLKAPEVAPASVDPPGGDRAGVAARLLAAWQRSRLAGRFARYTAGSVIAGVISQVTFVTLYGLELTGPQAASVSAFVAGAVPNYVMNRVWAWGRRGRARLRGEVLPYVATILTTAALAAVVTALVDRHVHLVSGVHAVQVAIVNLAFLGTYGLMFLIKFLLFERVVFRDRPSA